MTNLILKDYIFTRKQMLIAMMYCLAVPILLVMDGGDKNYWAQFFIPFAITSFLLAKIFYMEDATDVRYFLKLLPYSVYKRVGSRFCFMGITLIFAEVYLWAIQCIVFNQQLLDVIKGNAVPVIIFFIYFALYIMLAYCFGYLTAQNTIYICMVIAAVLAIAYEKLNFNINFAILANKQTVIVLSIVGMGIIFLFYLFSCKGEKRRGN
ncbi:MAG: ABC-2 transporter permease [Lachnospiraceae bacterium]